MAVSKFEMDTKGPVIDMGNLCGPGTAISCNGFQVADVGVKSAQPSAPQFPLNGFGPTGA